jgi:hypothetical protein
VNNPRENNVRNIVFSHFSNHFKAVPLEKPSVENFPFKTLSFVDAGLLEVAFAEVEVKQALWDYASFKSPSLDGIYFGFVKEFLDNFTYDI